MNLRGLVLGGVFLLAFVALVHSAELTTGVVDDGSTVELWMANGQVRCAVLMDGPRLAGDRVELLDRVDGPVYESDGGFAVELMWTGWRSPGKVHNGDNLIRLDAESFEVTGQRFESSVDGGASLILEMSADDVPFAVELSYELAPGGLYARKRIAVRDAEAGGHFLRRIWPLDATAVGQGELVKAGGFGEPVAFRSRQGGVYYGLEDPAGTNQLVLLADDRLLLRAGREVGKVVGSEPLASEWVVIGLSPDHNVRLSFERYLESVKVAPSRPYLLYNSWYDVRSPEYTERSEDVMNQANLERIMTDFAEVRERWPAVALDTFVLDDGWDVYESDWVLREREFPGGLRPVADRLAEMGTDLGIWFGPTGGYSYRGKRVQWMGEHGYEVVGDQMCVAGDRYSDLLIERTVDLVREHGVAYFKWDGFQFSCSEPDHGHPVGEYSRRAALETVARMSNAVRAENPEIFLNITSGTWLSPWWLKYADTIWMQGRDYGYSDVPSISRRDSAITYRDVVLHEDYRVHDSWFPISHLMTHGIIKGHLQKLGGESEPLDKFTDNAVLYFARGVAMWELYVSPNLLSDGEWIALAGAIEWARDRFDTLMSTEMVGGDPGAEEAYGYAHFSGGRGIVAVRNPGIVRQTIDVRLDAGVDPAGEGAPLVVERTYPSRWVSPTLHHWGDQVQVAVEGYETAVYEVYPLAEADGPLLAGVVFAETGEPGVIDVLEGGAEIEVLGAARLRSVRVDGSVQTADDVHIPARRHGVVKHTELSSDDVSLTVDLELLEGVETATLAVLMRPGEPGVMPSAVVTVDGVSVEAGVEREENSWMWLTTPVGTGAHRVRVELEPSGDGPSWQGNASAWLITVERPQPHRVELEAVDAAAATRPMPPSPWPEGTLKRTTELGSVAFGN